MPIQKIENPASIIPRKAGDLLQEARRRMPLGEREDGHLAAELPDQPRLRQVVRTIVTSLDVQVRTDFSDERLRRVLGEEGDVIHALQCGQQLQALRFWNEGTMGPLQPLHRLV